MFNSSWDELKAIRRATNTRDSLLRRRNFSICGATDPIMNRSTVVYEAFSSLSPPVLLWRHSNLQSVCSISRAVLRRVECLPDGRDGQHFERLAHDGLDVFVRRIHVYPELLALCGDLGVQSVSRSYAVTLRYQRSVDFPNWNRAIIKWDWTDGHSAVAIAIPYCYIFLCFATSSFREGCS